jgi:hypothetical protein
VSLALLAIDSAHEALAIVALKTNSATMVRRIPYPNYLQANWIDLFKGLDVACHYQLNAS